MCVCVRARDNCSLGIKLFSEHVFLSIFYKTYYKHLDIKVMKLTNMYKFSSKQAIIKIQRLLL